MFYAKKDSNGKWKRISKTTMAREVKQWFKNDRLANEAMRSVAPWSTLRLGSEVYTAADSKQELSAMDSMDKQIH